MMRVNLLLILILANLECVTHMQLGQTNGQYQVIQWEQTPSEKCHLFAVFATFNRENIPN